MSDIIWGIPGDFAPEAETFAASQLSQHEGWGQKERDLYSNWTNSQGEGVLVIVLDTIFDHDHPDLPRPFWSKNYARSTNRNMHGWHVGGIIGAINNDFGVVGVAPRCTLGWGAVLSDQGGGSTQGILQSVRDITKAWKEGWKNDFVGCVVNLSLGGPRDPNGQRAYDEANDAGICVVAAAGNSGANAGVDSPGNYISTIGTASYRSDGKISTFSSGGKEVDFAFPGEQIMSTVPGGRYQNASGTSMATPWCAGVAALIMASQPHNYEIKNTFGMREYMKKHSVRRWPENRGGYGVPTLSDAIRSKEDWYF